MKIKLRLEGPTECGKTYYMTQFFKMLVDGNPGKTVKIKKKEYPLVPVNIEEAEITISE